VDHQYQGGIQKIPGEKPETLIDVQRVARFYYLLRSGYGAKLTGQTYNVNTTRGPNINLLRIEEELSAAHMRLSTAYIENMPYERLIKRFDKTHTFFYIDPPYYGYENDYGKGVFEKEDFPRLNTLLRAIKGKFIVSLNDTKETRDLFKGFKIEKATTTYSVAANKKKKANELLIMNC